MRNRFHYRVRRCGVALATVLICLTLVMLLASIWVKGLTRSRQQLRVDHATLQAEYLAAAGANRAAARLAADASYAGEAWTLSAEELAARSGAVVKIDVRPGDDPQFVVVRATAIIPHTGPPQAQRTKEMRIPARQAAEQPQPGAAL